MVYLFAAGAWGVHWRVRVLLHAFAAVFLAGQPAWASAYFYAPGRGQVIVAAIFTEAWQQFDPAGKFVPSGRFRKLEAQAYIEIGVTDWFTAIIKPSLASTRFDSGASPTTANCTGSEVGGRLRVANLGALALAIEAKGILPSLDLGRNTALLADARGGADLRGVATFNFKTGAWPAFVDAAFGYRWRIGSPPSEWRGDLTLGIRPLPRFLVMLQSFNTISNGAGRPPFTRFRQSKLAASLVYDFSKDWSGQIGIITTIAGANAPVEQGVIAAAWRRF